MSISKTTRTSARRLSSAWGPFAQKLSTALAQLQEDQYLIISSKRTKHFVQFAAQGAHGIRAETVCNAYLPRRDQLDEKQIATLLGFGWCSPTGGPTQAGSPAQDPDGSPNFYVDSPVPVGCAALAGLATRTLSEVMRVPHPGMLQYTAFDASSNALLLPELGLMRAAPDADAAAIREQLLKTLRQETGIPDLEYDSDGDITMRYGSVGVILRLEPEARYLHMSAPLVKGVEESPTLLSRLNELNSSVSHPHFFVAGETVFAVTDVPSKPYEPDIVLRVLKDFCEIADGLDELLQTEFGGETSFEERMPSKLKH
jgi:Tir chaperone protein (CesT) family